MCVTSKQIRTKKGEHKKLPYRFFYIAIFRAILPIIQHQKSMLHLLE